MTAITDYATLQAEVLSLTERDDLTADVPGFIQRAEASFSRRLRTLQQQTSASLSLTDGAADLPADFEELISLVVPENPNRALRYVTPLEFQRIKYDNPASGAALAYTIRGNQILLAPGVGTVSTIDVLYYAAIPALSGSNTTNWLLTKWPDLYLYATAVEVAVHLRDEELIRFYGGRVEGIMSEIEAADRGAKYNGSPLQMRARGFRG